MGAPFDDPISERTQRSLATWRALLQSSDDAFDAEDTLGPAGVDAGEVLGRGGMGLVRRGFQRRLAREVAIKELLPERSGTPYARAAFLAEARITGHLDHPNVVPVHALHAAGSDIRIIMKMVRGERWVDLIRRDHRNSAEPFPLHEHLTILSAVCNAVAFAHAHGIVHRDIKPGNVMVGQFGEVWLMDWGLSLAIDDEVARTLRIAHRRDIRVPEGTPAYMAPEMANTSRHPISYRTDVFLLGATLFHVLRGAPPYPGPDKLRALQAAEAVQHGDLPESVPAELARICERAMAADPEQRYASAREFRAGVEAFRRHEQSLQLSSTAEAALDELGARTSAVRAEQGGADLYAALFDAIGGFSRARELWPRNEQANAGLRRARGALIDAALDAGDFGLARTQLVGSDASWVETHRARIDDSERRASSAQRSARRLRRGMALLAAAALAVTVGAVMTFDLVRRTLRREGDHLAVLHDARLVDELGRLVAGSAKLMGERRRAVELIATQYAREVTQALERDPPTDAPPPLLSSELPAGAPLAYDAPSFYFPPQEAAAAMPAIQRLVRANAATLALHSAHQSLVVRYFAGIAQGHILSLYPGAGGVSPEFDPVRRPWYRKALATGGVFHTPPYTDHTTHEVVVSTVVPMVGAAGEILGVAGVDTSLAVRLATASLPAHLSAHADVFVITPKLGARGAMQVVARREYKSRGTPEDLWHFDVALDELTLPMGKPGRRMRADLVAGHTGVVQTEWRGQAGTLAYAPIDGSDLVLLVFVPDRYTAAEGAALRERLRAHFDESLWQMARWVGVTLIALLLFLLLMRQLSRKRRA